MSRDAVIDEREVSFSEVAVAALWLLVCRFIWPTPERIVAQVADDRRMMEMSTRFAAAVDADSYVEHGYEHYEAAGVRLRGSFTFGLWLCDASGRASNTKLNDRASAVAKAAVKRANKRREKERREAVLWS